MQTQQGFCGRKGPAIGFSQEQFFVLEQRERETSFITVSII